MATSAVIEYAQAKQRREAHVDKVLGVLDRHKHFQVFAPILTFRRYGSSEHVVQFIANLASRLGNCPVIMRNRLFEEKCSQHIVAGKGVTVKNVHCRYALRGASDPHIILDAIWHTENATFNATILEHVLPALQCKDIKLILINLVCADTGQLLSNTVSRPHSEHRILGTGVYVPSELSFPVYVDGPRPAFTGVEWKPERAIQRHYPAPFRLQCRALLLVFKRIPRLPRDIARLIIRYLADLYRIRGI